MGLLWYGFVVLTIFHLALSLAAIMMEDSHTGQRYLRVKHFISRGIPSSAIVFVVVITIGYGLLLVAGM